MQIPTRIEQAEHRAQAKADVLLYVDGSSLVAFRRDAEACRRFASPGVAIDCEDVCQIPIDRKQQAIERLVAAGYRVAVLEPMRP